MTAESAAGESSEGVLLDEPTTADLRAKVTEAWQEFAGALASALTELAPGAPVSAYLMGVAVGRGADPSDVAARLSALALSWQKDDTAPIG